MKKSRIAILSVVLVSSLIILSCGLTDYPAQTEQPGPDFYSLFNGKDMSGWILGVEPEESAWSVVDGVIHCKGHPRNPSLILTERDYENFEFYAEFRVSKGGNSGIFYHVPLTGRASWIGFETQIQDDAWHLPSKNWTGSIYDVVPPLKNAMKRAGKWNQYHVRFDWPVCKVWLNGILVQDTDFSAYPLLKYRLRRGPIGLQNHGDEIDYRNIWIKELTDKDTGASVFNGRDLTCWNSIGDADWHVEDGMIVSTSGEGFLVTERAYDNIYFHAYVDSDTLATREARIHYRWKSVDDPGYAADLYNFQDAVKYTEQYDDYIPPDVIQPTRSPWLLYRIISGDRKSEVYLNEHLVSENRLLGKSPWGRIAIYRGPNDGVIRIKGLKLRELEGPGI